MTKDLTEKLYSETELILGSQIEMGGNKYIIVACRKLIPYLGEPKLDGYILTVEKEENDPTKLKN